MHTEAARLKVKDRADLGQDIRQDSVLLLVVSAVTTVHEYVLLATVTVHVADHNDATLLVLFLDHLFGGVDRRVQHLTWMLPPAIQITSGQRAAVITIYDAVRIQHRNDFEHVVLSQLVRLLGVWVCQEFDRPKHHEGADSFAWVLSRRQNNTFLVRASVTICDRQHGAVNYGQSLAQGRDHHILALDLIVLNRCKVSSEV